MLRASWPAFTHIHVRRLLLAVQLAERGSNIEVLAPLSGTQLWADVWVVPKGAKVRAHRTCVSAMGACMVSACSRA